MDWGNGYCFFLTLPNLTISFLIIAFTVITIRIVYVIHRSSRPLYTSPPQSLSTLIILGSGGHTAEMINLLSVLQKDKFTPRVYIAAWTDNMSLQKARVLEESLVDQTGAQKVKVPTQFMQIYRSREVGQSYLTSVGTTLLAMAHATWLMIKIRPQVIKELDADNYLFLSDSMQWSWNLYSSLCGCIPFQGSWN
uniref:UDP-N-acetylglucosamine transferase subunit ALG14 n=1 Tax=Nelumbo nucifera TaxID=4432 RepID=A0A822ZQQ2_NELNU|nr:TPA_asm: hypothetical protein HUJ06_017499 [Nelumbo nucifera]